VSARRPLLWVTAAVLLTGCVEVGSPGAGELACRTGDDGEPANGIVLMAQAVETASWLPCLDAVPLGWHLAEVQIRDGSGRFWLNSNRDGDRAIDVVLRGSCDVREATEIPSDREDVRRLERVTRLSPDYVGTRYYVFDGGCLAIYFNLDSHDRAEPLALATEGIDLLPRAGVEAQVHDESGGRLQLGPTSTEDGAP
jgi:hypothetical protein